MLYAGVAWHPKPGSPDTVHIVTASADKTARLFSREGKELSVLEVRLAAVMLFVSLLLCHRG